MFRVWSCKHFSYSHLPEAGVGIHTLSLDPRWENLHVPKAKWHPWSSWKGTRGLTACIPRQRHAPDKEHCQTPLVSPWETKRIITEGDPMKKPTHPCYCSWYNFLLLSSSSCCKPRARGCACVHVAPGHLPAARNISLSECLPARRAGLRKLQPSCNREPESLLSCTFIRWKSEQLSWLQQTDFKHKWPRSRQRQQLGLRCSWCWWLLLGGLWPTASVTGANFSASRPAAIKGN